MRFLADENGPIGVVEELIAHSHDVEWVARLTPGASDGEVLRHAARTAVSYSPSTRTMGISRTKARPQ
jgi:hypothetical protein